LPRVNGEGSLWAGITGIIAMREIGMAGRRGIKGRGGMPVEKLATVW